MKSFCISSGNMCKITSVDKKVSFNLEICEGSPYYEVNYKDKVFFEKSLLGHKIGRRDFTKNVSLKSVSASVVSSEFSIFGRVSKVKDEYVKADILLGCGEIEYTLEVRVYSDGVAFRHIYDASVGKTVNAEYTSFKVNEDSFAYASFGCRHKYCQMSPSFAHYEGICYEATYDRFAVKDIFYPTQKQEEYHELTQNAENAAEYILTPVTFEFPKNVYKKQYYGAILEGNLTNYVGINLRQKGNGRFEINTTYQPGRQFVDFDVTSENVVTPYRILTIADNLTGLYNNTIVYSVNKECSGDFSWVEPGRSAWSWRSEGGGPPTIELMHEYSLAAAALGYEYNILDGGWPQTMATETSTAHQTVAELCITYDKFDVKQVVWEGFTTGDVLGEKAKEKTDGVRLYTPDYNKIDKFIKDVYDVGVRGVKLDFVPPEDQVEGGVNVYENVAKIAAKYKMIIDYHGAAKPTGLIRTYPNILNYEGIYGHEMGPANQSFQVEAQLFTTQYLTRGLAGHADYTPHVWNGLGLAELVFVDAPFNAIDAKPSELLNSPNIEFIKACPTVWDETTVLSCSKFGKFAAIARNNGGNWFLGVINNGRTAERKIDLSEFLDKNRKYILELYTDDGIIKKCISGDEILRVKVKAYSGYAARISQTTATSYGGKYDAPIKLEFSEDGMYALYTTDGSDPANSSTAIQYKNGIVIKNSGKIRIAAYSSDNKLVNTLGYRYNIFD